MESKDQQVVQRVLLVEADSEIAAPIQVLLQEAGATVTAVSSADLSFESVAQNRPTLAIVAATHASDECFAVCSQLALEKASIPVVLASPDVDPFVRARARHAGVRKIIEPSLSLAEIQDLLEVSWESVDPLGIGADSVGLDQVVAESASDRLLQDLMGEKAPSNSQDLLNKLSDPLTGLLNADYFALKLEEESKKARRYGLPLSLLVASLDDSNELTVRYGAAAGEEALLEVAGVFLCESRDIDIAGRVGDGCFHLLMPNTNAEGAEVVIERLRESLGERCLRYDTEDIPLSVSLGIATQGEVGENLSPDQLSRLAEMNRLERAGLAVQPLPEESTDSS
jgi:diguanylate cyclase (GGDEF)-like protein